MSQPAILLESGMMYHIWTHANGQENLFRSGENYQYFLKKYFQYIGLVAETFAYCLMPNHLHLMIRIRKEAALLNLKKQDLQGFKNLGGPVVVSQQFSNLFNAYSKAYNKMYHRKGSLFVPNFKRKRISSESYFIALVVYIHRNPIHHRFADNIDDWPYSSWHEYIIEDGSRLNISEVISWFGNKETLIRDHREIIG